MSVSNEQWIEYLKDRDRRMLPVPNFVTRTDQTIVAWQDVPEGIQKKILSGTMTEEDWDSDWDIKPRLVRDVEDVVSEALNELPMPILKMRHVHVFRKEYPKCLIRGCEASRDRH